jgi:hypothetical protein
MNDNSLTGLNPGAHLSSYLLNHTNFSPMKTIASPPQGIPIWDTEEIEIFSLTLYK